MLSALRPLLPSIWTAAVSRTKARTRAPTDATAFFCKEFRVPPILQDAGAVFDNLDEDKSGQLEYKELNAMLRKGFGSEVTANLKRAKDVRDGGRGAKLTAKNLNENYQSAKLAALPPMV